MTLLLIRVILREWLTPLPILWSILWSILWLTLWSILWLTLWLSQQRQAAWTLAWCSITKLNWKKLAT